MRFLIAFRRETNRIYRMGRIRGFGFGFGN